MTKTTIFKAKSEGNKIPIEFIDYVTNTGKVLSSTNTPKSRGNIKLIVKGKKYDWMLAWEDGNPLGGCIFRGHWNDGVV